MPKNYYDKIVIADSSCLIALTNIGRLEILHRLCTTVTITPEIAEEYGEPLPEWMKIIPASNSETVRTIQQLLHLGESTAIALALETKSSLLIIDELRGRTVARNLGLDITGTLGILVTAFHEGIITDPAAVLLELKQHKFRIPENAEQFFQLRPGVSHQI